MHPPRIPGYELLQCLGGGPLTCVYSARDIAADEPCAIKCLRPEWEDRPTAVKLLQREARAGLAVRHPHLVRVLRARVTRPPYYLVMPLLPGEALRRRLQRDYGLDLPTALWIARQTAEALVALHRAGFCHGDFKPDNIHLAADGMAILLDLGFAHRPGENASLIEQGYLLGTADYLAPELSERRPAPDQSADWYSFGVTLFEMLTGEKPYPGGPVEETLRRHREELPASLRARDPSLPASLTRLVDRLLARSPADRPRPPTVVQQLIMLEIAAMRRKKSA